MRWLAAGIALWVGVASAEPYDALPPAARDFYRQAVAAEATGDLAGAAVRLKMVLRVDPTFARGAVDLGRVLERLGDLAGAEAAYRRFPYDAEAVEALGRLMMGDGRPKEAADAFRVLQQLAPERDDAHRLEAEATAAWDPAGADELLRAWLDFPGVTYTPELEAAVVRVCDGHREAGDGERERALLEDVAARWPEALDWTTARLDRYLVEDEARRLAGAAPEALDPAAQARLDAAREAYARGDLDQALVLVRGVVEAAPRSPAAWAALSDLAEARGDATEAERAIAWSLALAPLEPRYLSRLGDILANHYGGREDAAAIEAYASAIRQSPTWGELHLRRARVEARSGRVAEADRSLRRYLELDPDGRHTADARALLADLSRARPPGPTLPPSPGRPASVPDEAWWGYWRAQVYNERGDADLALAELAVARAAAPGYTAAINLEASIVLARGETARALALYRESLAADPRQRVVLLLVGELELRAGREAEAEALWREAAALGSEDAHYLLARAAARRWHLLRAREHLDAYFAGSTSGVHHEQARALRRDVGRRIAGAQGGAGLVGFGLVAVPALAAWRRRRGSTLADLLARSPRAWRDVARIGSALRHEVLKHNTTVLASVADALEDRDPEPAAWAAERLFAPRGPVERFWGYVRDLELLGRTHGVRLNLRHVDPVLGPLTGAMARLARLEGAMRGGGGRRLADELREVGRALNLEGYRALGALVRDACLVRIDVGVVQEAWHAVTGEVEFRDADVPDLVVTVRGGEPHVRVFRDELLDVLVNVLRNALQATLEAGAARLAVIVETEEDEVTFLERVAIRVADDAPRRITTALLRSRYIERGLGLTVDLISRNGGSIHVEDEPGWSKAVVVRWPLAEVEEA